MNITPLRPSPGADADRRQEGRCRRVIEVINPYNDAVIGTVPAARGTCARAFEIAKASSRS